MKKTLHAIQLMLFIISVAIILPSYTIPPSKKPGDWFCIDLKNTYQIEVVNARKQVSVSVDFCELITTNRKKSETVVIQLDENVRVRIFSEDELENLQDKDLQQIIYL